MVGDCVPFGGMDVRESLHIQVVWRFSFLLLLEDKTEALFLVLSLLRP